MFADLPDAMSPSSGVTADAIFHDRISPRRRSSARVEALRGIGSAPVVSSRITRSNTPPSSATELMPHFLPPVTGASVVPPRSLVARQSCPSRSDGLRLSGPFSGPDFFSFRNISRVSGIGCPADALPPYRVYRPSAGALDCLASTRNLLRLRGGRAAMLYVLVVMAHDPLGTRGGFRRHANVS